MKSSTIVKSVLVGTPVFLSGCGCSVTPVPVVTQPVVSADGVPVVSYAMPGYHYSPFYSGYVPIFIPLGGLGYGNSYNTYYNRLPAAERTRYATPTASGRASATPVSSTTGRTATPVSSGETAKPTTSTAASPSKTSSTSLPASSSTVRGIAGSTGLGTGSSAS